MGSEGGGGFQYEASKNKCIVSHQNKIQKGGGMEFFVLFFLFWRK